MFSNRQAFEQVKKILSKNLSISSANHTQSEAEALILAFYRCALGRKISRLQFYSELQNEIPNEVLANLLKGAEARASGKLLQHITGFQQFLDHEYEVSAEVLIPRPETELLCEIAIKMLSVESTSPKLGVEIGVGSGVLSIELLKKLPNLRMVASDVNVRAIQMTSKNALRILGNDPKEYDRLKLLWVQDSKQVCEPFHQASELADFLITNPPYLIAEQECEFSDEVIQNEPKEALFAPSHEPLYFYQQIASQSQKILKPSGKVFAEVPHERAKAILKLFMDHHWSAQILQDFTQRDRFLVASVGKNCG